MKFDQTYDDPWNGEFSFNTVYNGTQLRTFNILGNPNNYVMDSAVACRLLGNLLYLRDGAGW